jgi:hypothetical protein
MVTTEQTGSINQWYYSKGSGSNSSPGESFVNGTAFSGMAASRLRIDGPPGTEFILNYETGITKIGSSGFYELNLGPGNNFIKYLRFTQQSLDDLDK